LEKVSDAVSDYDMKTVIWDLTLKLEKGPIYIQHVEGTVFTAKQMIMEKEW
jgi:hypothetical protein